MRTARIGTRRWLRDRRLPRRTRGVVLGGVWLRCVTWWRAYDLDRELAAGANPMQSDELSLRVGQLGSARTRGRLTYGLRRAVDVADRPSDPLRTPPHAIRRAEIRANKELLLELAAGLRRSGPLGVEGLAMASLLVGEAPSPLYHKDASASLRLTALQALAGLEHGHRTASATDA
jgi:hypothetical protein